MSNVWWINHKNTYQRGSDTGVIYAGLDSKSRSCVEKVSPNDITVHSPSGCVVAIGRVETHAEEREVPFREKPGLVADVKYHEFPAPIDYQALATEICSRDVPPGPIHEPSGGTHGLQQVYCYPFNYEALAIVRELAGSWPPWPQARFPTQTQVAVDSENRAEGSIHSSSPEKREYEIYRVVRDTRLARKVKRRSDYKCQICGTDPVEIADGTVYAEAHHLHPLAEDGPDEEENIVCVCPTCHVKLDYGVEKLSNV
ncbi:MAG: HNH endonuclease [Salinibacter sp.]